MKKDVKSLKRPATMNLATTYMIAQRIASKHKHLSWLKSVYIVRGETHTFSLFHTLTSLLLNNHRVQ